MRVGVGVASPDAAHAATATDSQAVGGDGVRATALRSPPAEASFRRTF
jgi:hypothetical protein